MTTTPPSKFHRPPPHCIRCGYDLAGLPRTEKLCPECGHDARDRAQALLRRYCKPHWVRWAARTAWLMAAAYSLLIFTVMSQAVFAVLVVLAGDDQLRGWTVRLFYLLFVISLGSGALFFALGTAAAIISAQMWRSDGPIGLRNTNIVLCNLLSVPAALLCIAIPSAGNQYAFYLLMTFALGTPLALLLRVGHAWANKSARLLRLSKAERLASEVRKRRSGALLLLWVSAGVFLLFFLNAIAVADESILPQLEFMIYPNILIIALSASTLVVVAIGPISGVRRFCKQLRTLDRSIRGQSRPIASTPAATP